MAKVSVRQTLFLIVISLIAMRVIIEPSIMFYFAGRDGWLSYILIFAVQCLAIVMIACIIKNNPGKNIKQILESTFGKFIAKVLLFLFFCHFILRIVGIDYEMQNFLLEAIYNQLNWNIFVIPIFLLMLYVAIKGPRVFGRLSELFLPWSVVILLLTFILSLSAIEPSNLLPVLADGAKPVLKGFFFVISQMGEFLFLFFIMENINVKKENIVKSFAITSVITAACVVIFYAIFVSVFGDVAISTKEGIIRITQFSPFDNISFRIDGISSVLWIPMPIILSSMNIYCAGKSLAFLINPEKMKLPIVFCFLVILFIKFVPFTTSYRVINFNLYYFSYISIFLQLILPILILLIQKLKKENKSEIISSKNC